MRFRWSRITPDGQVKYPTKSLNHFPLLMMKSCNVSVVYQMNMQHAGMATSLMAGDILGAEAQTVIALIQEPYVVMGKGVGHWVFWGG